MHPLVKHFQPKVPFRKVVRVVRGVETTIGSRAATMKQVFELHLECGHKVQRDREMEKIRCKRCVGKLS
jgi:predicted SprT family Zn-dependent metalloprotease